MHDAFMHRCLELAVQGRGRVGNGAMVGAVLVRDGKRIAEGFHAAWGKEHAERQLLEKFEQKIDSKDTLYVNMEPCCPSPQKKTPPCSERILERGIRHVVIGMVDPRVGGEGIALLRSKGVTVEGPLLRAECEWLNRGFVSLHTQRRPWITLKQARTADGRIANEDGSPLAITSNVQNEWSHRFLRARHDAIVVGVHTIMCDNPSLTVRYGESAVQPWRLILDPKGRVPLAAKVMNDEYKDRTVLIVGKNRKKNAAEDTLRKKGVRVFEAAMEGESFAWDELWHLLTTPAGDWHGLTSILVEGGPGTWKRFSAAGMVDEEVTLMGG